VAEPLLPAPTTERGQRIDRWARRGALAAILLLFSGYALWGIAAPFAWGHYGYHGGFHGAAVRNWERHGIFTLTPHVGQSLPPRHASYVHHPVLGYQFSIPFIKVLGDQKEWVLRLVPVLFTLAILLVLIHVAGRWWGPWGGIAAGAVFVLLPHNLVFCQLVHLEQPAILYLLVALWAFVEFLRETRWRWAVACILGCLLAGLTDWTPYFIAFALAFAAAGHLLPQTVLPGRVAPSIAAWAVVVSAVLYVVHLTLTSRVDWPDWQTSLVVFGLFLAAVTGAAARATPGDRTGGRALGLRWGLTVGVGLTFLFTLWFHFKYTAAVGLSEDLRQAFNVRTGLVDFYPYSAKYLTNLKHTLTPPVFWLGAAWLLSLPVRIGMGRPLLGAVAPLAVLVGQVFYNLKFPQAADIHIYRTYYLVMFCPLVVVDLLAELGAALRYAVARFPRPELRRVPFVAVAVAVVALLGLEARAAHPVAKEGRYRSGTLRYFFGYRPELDKQLAFREIRALTSKRTVVLYTQEVMPRYEALWYVDRDVLTVWSGPRDAAAARRAAEAAARQWKMPWKVGDRPLVLVLPARAPRQAQALQELIGRYAITRLGEWMVVDYGKPGPAYRGYQIVERRFRSGSERYLRGPYRPLELRPDPLHEWQIVSRFGLPLAGRPALTTAPRPGDDRYAWAAWLDARVAAKDAPGAARAFATLRSKLRPVTPAVLSPDLEAVGVALGPTALEVYVRATRTHRPGCQLRLDSVDASGRDRRGRAQAVVPGLAEWPAGAVYVHLVTHRLPRGKHRLTLVPCGEAEGSGLDLGELTVP
jgi:4-amino-4-deoxy-L-arabinose transferase-like glycosyltransferase